LKPPHEHGHDTHEHSHGGVHNADGDRGTGGHAHLHGVVDATIASSERGIWVIKWSFVGLLITAVLQIVVFYFSNSVGLLADTIHNFADAGTAIPLGIAFFFGKMKPTKRFPFGYGRVEDLAGIAVVFIIFASAAVAAYESAQRLIHPQTVTHLGAVAAASIIGFIGNEGGPYSGSV
jgi:cation diffusion facilitator family transporter